VSATISGRNLGSHLLLLLVIQLVSGLHAGAPIQKRPPQNHLAHQTEIKANAVHGKQKYCLTDELQNTSNIFQIDDYDKLL
jgi:hypothetical protein